MVHLTVMRRIERDGGTMIPADDPKRSHRHQNRHGHRLVPEADVRALADRETALGHIVLRGWYNAGRTWL